MPAYDQRFTLWGMHPVVNIDEKIGKTVGRRRIKDSLEYGFGLQESLARIREDAPSPRFPRGVFKFRSFEEADAWTMHYLTKPRS
ncbi:MAG: hypothetical protein ACKOD5_09070 [Chthoniobacterales bacterium]